MQTNNEKNNQSCQTCYRIACKKCEWVASEKEVLQIQEEILTACPICGWKPNPTVITSEHRENRA